MQQLRLSEEVDVFKFKVFTPDFISLLLQEVEHISGFPGLILGRPNSMNYNGVSSEKLRCTQQNERYHRRFHLIFFIPQPKNLAGDSSLRFILPGKPIHSVEQKNGNRLMENFWNMEESWTSIWL